MSQDNKTFVKSKTIIDDVQTTDETLSSRGGLSLFVRFLRNGGLLEQIGSTFGTLRKSRKGQPIEEIFKQLLCFFMDGSSRHLSYFDHLKQDGGYAAVIESHPEQMLSSHALKRFFKSFRRHHLPGFRRLLQDWFIEQLRVLQPAEIILGLDSVVLDNDEALRREGVRPTYRKVKGFEPLQLCWDRLVVDAKFRSGSRHSNHGNDALEMIKRAVSAIRKGYRADVPIIVRMDAGFFDQTLFEWCETHRVGYIAGGKLYPDINAYATGIAERFWSHFDRPEQRWQYIEWGDRRGSWRRFRRIIFCRPLYEHRQMLLDFARPDTVIYTNLAMGYPIDEGLQMAGLADLLTAPGVIGAYHHRGSDELVHRAFKDFGFEQLPFKRFMANAAFYFCMMIAFVLFEVFKHKVCIPVVATSAYATTVRRRLIDVAAKLVRHAGRIILKVPRAIFELLDFERLWKNSATIARAPVH